MLLGFDRSDDSIATEWPLPATFTEEDAARLVGRHPDLIGSSFLLSPAQLAGIAPFLGHTPDPDRIEYFFEAQDDSYPVG